MNPSLNNIFYYILIVDDDPDDHFLLRHAISKSLPDALVDSLYDGEHVIDYLRKAREMPNVIFLDLNMKKLSGEETMKVIRENEVLKSVPVVILTTSRSEDEKARLLSLGAAEFFSKPQDNNALIEIVEQVKSRFLT